MLELLIDGLAVYRLARLVAYDNFPPIARLRERILERQSPWSEIVVCIWCCSFWFGIVAASARYALPGPWSVAALVLALSSVAGIVDSLLER